MSSRSRYRARTCLQRQCDRITTVRGDHVDNFGTVVPIFTTPSRSSRSSVRLVTMRIDGHTSTQCSCRAGDLLYPWSKVGLDVCLLASAFQNSNFVADFSTFCRAISLASASLSTMCLTWRPKRRWAAVNYGAAPPTTSPSLGPRPITPRNGSNGGVDRPASVASIPLGSYANAAQGTSLVQRRRSSQIGPRNERLSADSVRP